MYIMRILSTVLTAVIVALTAPVNNSSSKKYDEVYRPQYHFTPQKNWQSNPNGLVYYDGEYHMFYQYNPNGKEWEYMHWGHAISTDLIHWEHLPVALYPDESSTDKDNCTVFSGSAIVDDKDLLDKQEGDIKTLVAFYTSNKCGQRIAYSTDKGRTWYKHDGNPVINYNENEDARDPKVFWHDDTGKYVMVLYRKSTDDENSRGISIYTSENLIDWNWESHVPGFYESPDLIEFKVSNRPNETIWALFGGDGTYILGDFDGRNFSPTSGKMKSDWGKNFYASQTWNNIPDTDGRVIQVAWMKGAKYPQMPFNGQMSFPSEMMVSKFPTGYKLVRKPIAKINELHGKHYNWSDKIVIPGINQNRVKKVSGDCIHLIGEFDLKTSDNFGFMFRHHSKKQGIEVLYNVKRGVLTVLGSTVPLLPEDNIIKLEVLLDRTSIEIYANNGQAVVSNCFVSDEKSTDVVLFTNGGELGIVNLDVYHVESIWND